MIAALLKKNVFIAFQVSAGFLLLQGAAERLAADTTAEQLVLKQNIVKITSVFVDDDADIGFGFVFGEHGDSLNIVSTLNVILSDYDDVAKSIKVHFYNDSVVSGIKLVKHIPELNFALFRIKKPSHFQWHPEFRGVGVHSGQVVWLLGRYGEWNDQTEEFVGQITRDDYDEIRVDFSGTKEGKRGAILIARNRIAGMVINDQGFQATVLPIHIIRYYVCKWLNIKYMRYLFNPPFLMAGGHVGWSGWLSSNAGQMNVFTGNYGLFAGVGLTGNLAVRFQTGWNSILSNTVKTFDQEIQFRNRYRTFSIIVDLFFKSRYYVEQTESIFFGYSLIRQKPEVRMNNSGWRELENMDGFNFDYSNKAHSFVLGGSNNGLFRSKFISGADFGIRYTTSKYLHINVLEPLKENKYHDWLFFVSLRMGFVFGNKQEPVKYLK